MPIKISYTITNTIEVDESVFIDMAAEDDKDWAEMSNSERVEFVMQSEKDNNYDEERQSGEGSVEITDVIV